MLVWWTKRSLLPSSGVMKPKPFSSLNHLTVPVAMYFLHGDSSCCVCRGSYIATVCERLHCFRRTISPGRTRRTVPRPAGTQPLVDDSFQPFLMPPTADGAAKLNP